MLFGGLVRFTVFEVFQSKEQGGLTRVEREHTDVEEVRENEDRFPDRLSGNE
jgi:hypothetical protein